MATFSQLIKGSELIGAQDGPLAAGPGDRLVLKNGASATYRGTAGTSVFYVLHPRIH